MPDCQNLRLQVGRRNGEQLYEVFAAAYYGHQSETWWKEVARLRNRKETRTGHQRADASH